MAIKLTNGLKGDPVIWTSIAILCVYSLLAIYSGISTMPVKPSELDLLPERELMKQLLLIVSGLIIMWSIHLMKWRAALKKLAPVLLLLTWGLLIVTMAFGVQTNSAVRSLQIGFITIQSFDIAKLVLIIYLSTVLVDIRSKQYDFKKMLLWVYAPILITCGLMLRANLSTVLITYAVAVCMLFYGRLSFKQVVHFFALSLACFLLVAVVVLIFPKVMPRASVWKSRVEMFFMSEKKRAEMEATMSALEIRAQQEKDFQARQAEIAIGVGGIVGKGPGGGTQRHILPQSYDDYIFAIIVEEYGILFGAIPLVVIYLILLYRGMRISIKSSRQFSSYLVFGITFLYTLQAFIHIMVSVGLFPVTGQPLPFVSRGGTALWMACAAFGLVLSESRINEREQQEGVVLEEQEALQEEFAEMEIQENNEL